MARDDFETRRERQRQGVQIAKLAGKYSGRVPDIIDPAQKICIVVSHPNRTERG